VGCFYEKDQEFFFYSYFSTCNYRNICCRRFRVGEPRHSSTKYPGSIDSVDFFIRPHGTYMEMNIQIVFTPEGSPFSSITDTLEATMNFSLPDKAFINNMWLYMNETGKWIKAILLDKWTAGFIYESTVQRMVDPSILTKTSATNYTIKVFPLLGDSYRIVRMNIFIPCDWSKEHISANLPIDFINASKYLPDKVSLYVFPEDDFDQPFIKDNMHILFREENDHILGNHLRTEIYQEDFGNAKELMMVNNTKESFVALDYWGDEKFYQLVLNVEEFVSKQSNEKIAFLLDYDILKSNITREQVFDGLKKGILEFLKEGDQFNIFISGDEIHKVSDVWLSADTNTVNEVFNEIEPTMLDVETHLSELALIACDWVEKNAEEAKILLIANSDKHGSLEVANKLGQDIFIELLDKKISFSIATFIEKGWTTNLIYSIAYTGNDYLYSNLSRMSRGIFKKLQVNGKTIENLVKSTLGTLLGTLDNVSIHTTFSNGYSYETFNNSQNNNYQEDNFLFEYGKFKGDLPMRVEFSGEYRKKHFFNSYEIGDESQAGIYDCKSIWAAQSLKKMETTQTSDNLLIYEIINESLEYNVLALFTAFLAIEKKDSQDTSATSVEDIMINDGGLKATLYPNPFYENLNIRFEIEDSYTAYDLTIEIYDAMGRMIRSFGTYSKFGNELNLNWNGYSDSGQELPDGIYFIHVKFGKLSYVLKVVKLRF